MEVWHKIYFVMVYALQKYERKVIQDFLQAQNWRYYINQIPFVDPRHLQNLRTKSQK